MESLFQEFITSSNELVYSHSSAPRDPRFVSEQRFANPSSSFSVPKSATTEDQEEEDYPNATLNYIREMLMEEEDYPNATLNYISEMLMEEEDLEKQPFMFWDSMALQATEKHLSDVLNGTDSPPKGFSQYSHLSNSLSSPFDGQHDLLSLANGGVEETDRDRSPPKGKQNHECLSSDHDSTETNQRNKHLAASYLRKSEPLDDMCYDVLLDPVGRNTAACTYKKLENTEPRAGGITPCGKKRPQLEKEFIDFSGLLTQCAKSIAIYDTKAAIEALKEIRLHSSPYGNGIERTAFYLANALEARLNGTGTSLYVSKHFNNILAADILEAFQMYIKASPFDVVSIMMLNKCIMKLAARATRLHIIDFGIMYGFQWPSLIQGLSMRPGGPPVLRITAIDFLQPGFRPEELANATGLRLESYCEEYNVPFEFKSVARKWESITLEDLDIDRDDDVLVVNCLKMLGTVPDEILVPHDSPRDIVLNLIKNINPDMFTHGIMNGAYNSAFFASRFREVLFHYSSLFDMFDVTVPSEDKDRWLFEEMVFGRNMLNVIACEGEERVDRPETYKNWQARSLRAGLQQLPLDQEIVDCVREKVKSDYNKNFYMEEDGNWLLQGWKGRVLQAISFWKPNNN